MAMPGLPKHRRGLKVNAENNDKHEVVHLTKPVIRANMANGKASPTNLPETSPLVAILAEMLRSALSWEEDHKSQNKNDGGKKRDNRFNQ
jgi:hypothetical protein